MYTVGTTDGGAIVIDGLEPPSQEPSPRKADGTLAGEVGPAIAEWVADAVAAGVTFEVLRSCAKRLLEIGWTAGSTEPSIETVSATLARYLSSIGYLDIRLMEVRPVAGQGWLISAIADGATVRARADPTGQLLHVRVE